jgi:hypothetical protein
MGVYSYGFKGAVAGAKAGATKLFQKLSGQGKTTGTEVIKSFKPGTEFKGIPKYQKEIIKAKSEVQKKFNPINENIANETKKLKQKLQGMRGERITQSGITKGKDLVKKAKGGRVGLRLGSRKSNLQKIQAVFGPKQTKKKDKVKRMMAKKGSPNPKKKKKFPDLTGDGKVTFADILKGRGVINGKKKKNKKKFI